jgi:hypothetical protein
MKKLMFATALVASVAAFADAPTAINAVGFEGYNLGETFGNGKGETNEAGTGNFFYFEGDSGVSNSSVVTNETPSANKRTAFFAAAENTDKYLALDTEGGTFWRGLSNPVPDGDTWSLGEAKPVKNTGTYLDTLVQFTVTEDDAPTTTADDKLAIWLGVVTNAQGEVTGTNLMVRAKAWTMGGGAPRQDVTDFAVTNVAVEAGTWYRLTVKAVQTVIDPSQMIVPAFQIYIDNTELVATTPQFSSDIQNAFTVGNVWKEGMATLASANKLFPTLAVIPGNMDAVTLQGVGFQGTGAVDEIVWTEDDLFPAGGPTVVDYTFTLTLDTNVTGAAVTTNGAAVVFDNGTAQILAGTTVSIAEPTFAPGYQLNTITTNETVVVSPTFPITFTMDAAMTVAITSELIPATYPTYVGEDASLKTQYDAWKNGKTVGDGESYEKQFLLNTATDTVVADDALQIDSITEVQGGWDIVVSTTVTGAALSDGSATTYNGYLLVKSADTLAGLEAATPASYTVTPAADGKVKITVTAGKFMKVVLTTTAPAQN